jgi:ornithine cyclodeaminase/alanine dehydrogenase-like protein (mu-crystallin family)
MNNIQFLSDESVHQLLINLIKDEAITFRNAMEQTFEDFSAAGERQYQPDPSSATRPNCKQTLFRPFTSDSTAGTKLVVESAPTPDCKRNPLHGVLILLDGQGNPTGVLSAEEVTGYRTSMNAMGPFSWRKLLKISLFLAGEWKHCGMPA